MLTKEEIDKSFTDQMPTLKKMIMGVKVKTGKTYIETDSAISEAYLHISNIENISTEKELQSIIINFLNKSIIWTNSKLSKQEKVSDHNEKIKHFNQFSNEDFISSKITKNIDREDTNDIDLEKKILIEQWYDEKKCILQIYREQEKDKLKQIIYDCYFVKKITKGVRLAEHLKMNKDNGCRYIRELKQDIREFYGDYNNNK